MKHLLAFCAAVVGASLSYSASAETIISVTQISYDANLRSQCTAVRMNPAVYGSLPASACTLGTAGADGPDRITKNTYDAAGQLTQIDQAYGTPVQRAYARYTYNANGTKQYEIDARSYYTEYMYDGFDRLSRLQYPCPNLQNCANSSDYETYGYDANNNRTSWRRRDGNTILYTYDNLNREIVKDMPGGTSDDLYTGYDGLGHILYKRFVSSTGSGVSYAYDGLGRVSSTTDINGRTVGYAYYLDSTRSSLTYPDNQAQNYLYYNNGVLGWTGNAAQTVVYQYYFDSLMRPTAVGKSNSANSFYAYDPVGRLTGMTHDLAGTAYDITWSFTGRNAANQITKWGATSTVYDYKQLAAATTNNTYDGLNRDAAIAALSGGYDARGNMTFDGVRTMTYDLENRLKTVSAPGISLQLDYDPEGRLSKLTSSGAVTSFLYDGVNLIAEYDGAGNMTKRYMHTLGTDQPWVEFSGSAVSTGNATYLYANYQGSIIATADMSGNLTNLYKYGPYGEPKDGNNVDSWSGERFRYTGQIMIPEAKLYYYKARVYDPIAGRFLQTDPVGSEDDLDLYSYVGGDPVNTTDPSGEIAVNCTVTVTVNKDGQQVGDLGGSCTSDNSDGDDTHAHITVTVESTTVDNGKVVGFNSHTYNTVTKTLTWQSLDHATSGVLKNTAGFNVTTSFGADRSHGLPSNMSGLPGVPLRGLHSEEAMRGNQSSTNYWRNKSTEEIEESLKPGQPESLKVKSDGTIMNGNTRVQILKERGVNVDQLPREPYP